MAPARNLGRSLGLSLLFPIIIPRFTSYILIPLLRWHILVYAWPNLELLLAFVALCLFMKAAFGYLDVDHVTTIIAEIVMCAIASWVLDRILSVGGWKWELLYWMTTASFLLDAPPELSPVEMQHPFLQESSFIRTRASLPQESSKSRTRASVLSVVLSVMGAIIGFGKENISWIELCEIFMIFNISLLPWCQAALDYTFPQPPN
ncbi:hypothetical protein BCR34DRAFT_608416 [Clohesyomyces aquaticus]|uniref:Uncharacterized protein n=1 Tax=Clohesyomyces aquaticus TaxID=1231657 RepID=A0A1Y1Y7G5_9PLEO|nr:hypothetical protein BCR34DRAFT_608416 [Clohesyomyces aquaticus]